MSEVQATKRTESAPRVFISYSHDSEEHRERILALADRLTNEGIDCHVDRYYETPPPAEGWPEWMLRQVERADFVLVVCTEVYHRRFRRQEEAGKGLGAQWEGAVITQQLYNSATHNAKFIPVGFETYSDARSHIPITLQGANYYDVGSEKGYANLYRHLTSQPEVVRPPLGQRKTMPLRQSTSGTGRPTNAATTTAISPPTEILNFSAAELRRLMTERLSRTEVGVLWFDLFGSTMDEELPGRSKPECIIELLSRCTQRGKMEAFVAELARSYPHVLEAKRGPH